MTKRPFRIACPAKIREATGGDVEAMAALMEGFGQFNAALITV
jgi:hypothetical protein